MLERARDGEPIATGSRQPALPAPPVGQRGDRRAAVRSGRVFDFPRVRVSAEEHDERMAGKELGAWLVQCDLEDVFVIESRHGRRLSAVLPDVVEAVTPPFGAGRAWADLIGRRIAASRARGVVALGGGRCLDLAKSAAAGAGVPVIVVPTQLSHDGICSPVSVLPDAAGLSQSLPVVFPSAVFFSVPTLRRAPVRSMRAGLGDLLTNPFAIRDWELAAIKGQDEIDDEAWHLSLESTELVEPWLWGLDDAEARDPAFLTLLAHALVNSGLAMMQAGSSRPASGAEHKISHAIDLTFGGRARHGEQVAFACILSAALHGLEVAPVVAQLRALDLPSHPRHLGLDAADLARVLVAAPATRPGRFTILEQAELSHRDALNLVESLWGKL